MATNSPLSSFLTNFASAYSGVSSSRPDPLREAAFEADMMQWQEERPYREARTELTQAQADAAKMEVQEGRRAQAMRAFGEAELRANELGGLERAFDDPVFKQRAIRAVNLIGDNDQGYELVDYQTMNRNNAEQWGMDANVYEEVLTGMNPSHVPGTDDDEVLVPIYRHPDGTVGPADLDADGTIEAYSARQAVEQLRGQFVGSDEYATALQSLYTGQPGGSVGGGAGAQQPQAQQPQAQQPQAQQPQAQALTPQAILAANQTAEGGQQGGQQGEVAFEQSDPTRTRRQLKKRREELLQQERTNPTDPQVSQELAETNRQLQELDEFEQLWDKYGKDPEVGKTASVIPGVDGESGETTLGVPREQVPSDAPRAVRRVAEGKGISPAQAKELALNPEQLPQPTPRAAVAAGANLMKDLEPEEQGQGQSAGVGGSAGGFRVTGGRRPTHKQLTTATILNRAGLLDTESLTRFADLGVISSDGVSVIQTGMQQAAQTQRQAMVNQTTLQQEAMRQQGAMERTVAEAILDREQTEEPTFKEVLEQNEVAAKSFFQAQGMDEEMADQNAQRVAAKITNLGADSRAFRAADWRNPAMVRSVAELDQVDRTYNDVGLMAQGTRWVTDRRQNLNLSENPLAILLHAEGSPIMSPEDRGIIENIVRLSPVGEAAIEATGQEPDFVTTIEEPMFSAAAELGQQNVLQRNPDIQKRIYDFATVALREEMRATGDRSVLRDKGDIQDVIREATRVVLGGQ